MPNRRETLSLGVAPLLLGAWPHAEAAGFGGGDLTQYVDPFIGTDGTGHVTPAAMVPFGMVAPGPDHADRGWSYSSGYQWRAPRVLGFSNTHISGAGIPELGDVLLMPRSGLHWGETTTDFSDAMDKRSEAARAGVYRLRLPDHGVRVELSCTARMAVHRYSFDAPGRVQVLVDLQHGLHFVEGPRVTAASHQVLAERGEVEGTVHSRNWVERQTSFLLRFDHPIARVTALPPRPGELAPRLILEFDLGRGAVLEARVALSTVDEAGARRNLEVDAALSFRSVRAAADARWQALLARLRIDADAATKRLFYSALYRTLLHPSDIADADGRVRGPKGEVLQAPGGVYYSTLSLWDTFRASHPLFTLLVPERVNGLVETLVAHHRQMGYLPLWTAWGRETHTMIGNPALPVIADALAKGLVRDPSAAVQAMLETSTRERPDAPAWAQRSWQWMDKLGYLPFDGVPGESVSKTAEYGYGDAALAQALRQQGRTAEAERFARRAAGWKRLWDPSTQTLRGKDSQGRWREPFDPAVATSPMNNPGDYTEANAWQYSATPALHDAEGLRAQLGGAKGLEAWLDRFFTLPVKNPDKHLGQEALIGQYAHGNEPSHHIAWLYAFTNAPEKGQARVAEIVRRFYSLQPDGIVGNDDAGQMSAWLVFALLGLYPVEPMKARYVVGRPLVQGALLTREGGDPLHLQGRGPHACLDGRAVPREGLAHAALLQARTLRWQASPCRG